MSEKNNTVGDSFTREEIREIASGFQRSRVLLTAYELDLFSALGKGPATSADVASAIGTDQRATDRLMNALCTMGFLRSQNGVFTNTESAAELLVRGSPGYIAGLMHTVHLWDTWSTLTAAVRQGRTIPTGETGDRDGAWLHSFIAAMHDRAVRTAPAIIAQMDLAGVSRVLDVGGGSGVYAMAFIRADPSLRATVFDLPEVIPLTGQYLEREGLRERVEIAAGDYLNDDLGSDFDLVFLSAIIHSNSVAENRLLMARCTQALKTGGRVVVQDFIMDEDRTTPVHGALFALNMLVGTRAGDTYTEFEVRSWMEEAGLMDITRQETGFGTTQIIGRKKH